MLPPEEFRIWAETVGWGTEPCHTVIAAILGHHRATAPRPVCGQSDRRAPPEPNLVIPIRVRLLKRCGHDMPLALP